jgi:hypothetical protein
VAERGVVKKGPTCLVTLKCFHANPASKQELKTNKAKNCHLGVYHTFNTKQKIPFTLNISFFKNINFTQKSKSKWRGFENSDAILPMENQN